MVHKVNYNEISAFPSNVNWNLIPNIYILIVFIYIFVYSYHALYHIVDCSL